MSVLHQNTGLDPLPRRLRDFEIVQLERERLGLEADERTDPST
jgi:hypothetical protein